MLASAEGRSSSNASAAICYNSSCEQYSEARIALDVNIRNGKIYQRTEAQYVTGVIAVNAEYYE